MASSPKIKVTIPASLKLTAKEKASLKAAFKADVVRVLKKHGGAARNDIINILPTGTKKTAKKKAKKAGKKK